MSRNLFIDIEDKFTGVLLSYELSTEYSLFKYFAVGAGLAKLAISADIKDDDWLGSVADSYRGYMLFGILYF